jgi:hypothetical protein
MTDQADQQIAQRHARQPADQQRLIVNERANIEGSAPQGSDGSHTPRYTAN